MTDLDLAPLPDLAPADPLPSPRRGAAWIAPVVAATLAVVAGILKWDGVDMPAQLYRVTLFQAHGLTLWDSQWYGGHFTFSYSVIFPPVAATVGVRLTMVLSAAVAALTFDRLVVGHFGRQGRWGSLVFALGTLAPVAIGQGPYLMGQALALTAFWAAARNKRVAAVVLAIAASLASPLAGGFLALAAGAWLLTSRRHLRVGLAAVVAAAVVPVLASSVLFPGQGSMPFSTGDFLAEGGVFVAAALCIPTRQRALRLAVLVYLVAFVACFVFASPIGGNIERLGEMFGPGLVTAALWPAGRRLVAVALTIPLLALQVGPAMSALTAGPTNPSANAAYFQPLATWVLAHDTPLGRVEIVPTAGHWEAAYAAPSIPLARGWERQLDTADNPIFYTKGLLDAASYQAWLVDNGVRYVALPDVPLDYAAKAEGALVAAGVPGLDPVWHNAHWRVFAVAGSAGIVSGPAQAVTIAGDSITLDATTAGTVHLKERYSPKWAVVTGDACVRQDSGDWMAVDVLRPGALRLELRLVGPADDAC